MKKSSRSLVQKFLLVLPYLFGLIDMIIRFFPIFILNYVTTIKNLITMQKILIIYATNFQYLPHLLFTGLYIGIVRSQIREFSYFVKYHIMLYLVLFTFEQLLYDLFVRLCFNYFDTSFGLSGAVICLSIICLLALDCIIQISRGRYTDIPLITDAVLVHLGDRRKLDS